MTPALLQGYSRTRRRGTSLAYLSPDGYDPYSTKKSTTTGFLIFGLSPEALASLTHLYEDGGPRHLFEEGPSDTSRWNETQLSLKDVTVSISVTEGTNVDVRAVTFATAASAFVSWRGQAWDVNDFLRSVSFSKMTNRMEAGESIREESEIASALGTNILLLGDRLVAKVIKNSPDELQRLLNHGYDVDAPSGEYGTALQAAASKGNVTLVLMLIDAGADMDAEGGEYGCALIAAVVWKHDVVVKTLLSYGANVFTAGGRYISALYQAVDFGHTEIAHMLLEKGAWMTEDYRELLDLAAERGNRDIRRELELYDVRQMHLLKSPSIGIRETNVEQHKAGTNQVSNVFEDFVVKYELGIHQSTKPRQTSLQKNTKLGVSVLLEMGKLKGQVGKWTGIKGVKLLRVALENGFPERMIKDLRPYMHRWSLIQEFFTNTLKGTLGDAVKPVQHTKLLDVEEEHRDALRRYY
jgi:ankyrin repeat protein